MNCIHPILSATLLAACLLPAQDPPNRQPGSRQPPPDAQQPRDPTRPNSNVESKDAVLLTWLLVENENEIALARIAQQRATNPEVRQFAQMMIDDHGQFVQKLQQASGATADRRLGQNDRNRPTNRDPKPTDPSKPTDPKQPVDPKRPTDPHNPGNSSGVPADASGVRSMGAFDHEQLLRDLGKECLSSSTTMLQDKQGAEFDRCYMGIQVGAHVKAVDMLEVFQRYASPSLRTTLADGHKTVQMHLQKAKDLAKRTEQASNTGSGGSK